MQMLDLSGVAKVLGLSRRKVQKDVARGAFGPSLYRFGRSVRVREDELFRWIEAGCPKRDRWVEIRETAGAGESAGAR